MQKSAVCGSQGILVGIIVVGDGGMKKVAVASGRTIIAVEVASGTAPTFRAGAQETRKKAKVKRGKKNFILFWTQPACWRRIQEISLA
jgi:hypothetical protein